MNRPALLLVFDLRSRTVCRSDSRRARTDSLFRFPRSIVAILAWLGAVRRREPRRPWYRPSLIILLTVFILCQLIMV